MRLTLGEKFTHHSNRMIRKASHALRIARTRNSDVTSQKYFRINYRLLIYNNFEPIYKSFQRSPKNY